MAMHTKAIPANIEEEWKRLQQKVRKEKDR